MKYDHTGMEAKWQKQWEEKGVFHASNDSDKPKYYTLIEFPYPSGQGLHVGHPRSYTALDIVARKRRLMGYNVLYPIGWDAFGLPTENFAIKNHVHPEVVTKKNIARFKRVGRTFNTVNALAAPKAIKLIGFVGKCLEMLRNGSFIPPIAHINIVIPIQKKI